MEILYILHLLIFLHVCSSLEYPPWKMGSSSSSDESKESNSRSAESKSVSKDKNDPTNRNDEKYSEESNSYNSKDISKDHSGQDNKQRDDKDKPKIKHNHGIKHQSNNNKQRKTESKRKHHTVQNDKPEKRQFDTDQFDQDDFPSVDKILREHGKESRKKKERTRQKSNHHSESNKEHTKKVKSQSNKEYRDKDKKDHINEDDETDLENDDIKQKTDNNPSEFNNDHRITIDKKQFSKQVTLKRQKFHSPVTETDLDSEPNIEYLSNQKKNHYIQEVYAYNIPEKASTSNYNNGNDRKRPKKLKNDRPIKHKDDRTVKHDVDRYVKDRIDLEDNNRPKDNLRMKHDRVRHVKHKIDNEDQDISGDDYNNYSIKPKRPKHNIHTTTESDFRPKRTSNVFNKHERNQNDGHQSLAEDNVLRKLKSDFRMAKGRNRHENLENDSHTKHKRDRNDDDEPQPNVPDIDLGNYKRLKDIKPITNHRMKHKTAQDQDDIDQDVPERDLPKHYSGHKRPKDTPKTDLRIKHDNNINIKHKGHNQEDVDNAIYNAVRFIHKKLYQPNINRQIELENDAEEIAQKQGNHHSKIKQTHREKNKSDIPSKQKGLKQSKHHSESDRSEINDGMKSTREKQKLNVHEKPIRQASHKDISKIKPKNQASYHTTTPKSAIRNKHNIKKNNKNQQDDEQSGADRDFKKKPIEKHEIEHKSKKDKKHSVSNDRDKKNENEKRQKDDYGDSDKSENHSGSAYDGNSAQDNYKTNSKEKTGLRGDLQNRHKKQKIKIDDNDQYQNTDEDFEASGDIYADFKNYNSKKDSKRDNSNRNIARKPNSDRDRKQTNNHYSEPSSDFYYKPVPDYKSIINSNDHKPNINSNTETNNDYRYNRDPNTGSSNDHRHKSNQNTGTNNDHKFSRYPNTETNNDPRYNKGLKSETSNDHRHNRNPNMGTNNEYQFSRDPNTESNNDYRYNKGLKSETSNDHRHNRNPNTGTNNENKFSRDPNTESNNDYRYNRDPNTGPSKDHRHNSYTNIESSNNHNNMYNRDPNIETSNNQRHKSDPNTGTYNDQRYNRDPNTGSNNVHRQNSNPNTETRNHHHTNKNVKNTQDYSKLNFDDINQENQYDDDRTKSSTNNYFESSVNSYKQNKYENNVGDNNNPSDSNDDGFYRPSRDLYKELKRKNVRDDRKLYVNKNNLKNDRESKQGSEFYTETSRNTFNENKYENNIKNIHHSLRNIDDQTYDNGDLETFQQVNNSQVDTNDGERESNHNTKFSNDGFKQNYDINDQENSKRININSTKIDEDSDQDLVFTGFEHYQQVQPNDLTLNPRFRNTDHNKPINEEVLGENITSNRTDSKKYHQKFKLVPFLNQKDLRRIYPLNKNPLSPAAKRQTPSYPEVVSKTPKGSNANHKKVFNRAQSMDPDKNIELSTLSPNDAYTTPEFKNDLFYNNRTELLKGLFNETILRNLGTQEFIERSSKFREKEIERQRQAEMKQIEREKLKQLQEDSENIKTTPKTTEKNTIKDKKLFEKADNTTKFTKVIVINATPRPVTKIDLNATIDKLAKSKVIDMLTERLTNRVLKKIQRRLREKSKKSMRETENNSVEKIEIVFDENEDMGLVGESKRNIINGKVY